MSKNAKEEELEVADLLSKAYFVLFVVGEGLSAHGGLKLLDDVFRRPNFKVLNPKNVLTPSFLKKDSDTFFGVVGSAYNETLGQSIHPVYDYIRNWLSCIFLENDPRFADKKGGNVPPPQVDPKAKKNIIKQPASRFFLVTSNIDGDPQKVGLPIDKIYETRGTMTNWQCSRPCKMDVWSIDEDFKFKVDENDGQAHPVKYISREKKTPKDLSKEETILLAAEERLRNRRSEKFEIGDMDEFNPMDPLGMVDYAELEKEKERKKKDEEEKRRKHQAEEAALKPKKRPSTAPLSKTVSKPPAKKGAPGSSKTAEEKPKKKVLTSEEKIQILLKEKKDQKIAKFKTPIFNLKSPLERAKAIPLTQDLPLTRSLTERRAGYYRYFSPLEAEKTRNIPSVHQKKLFSSISFLPPDEANSFFDKLKLSKKKELDNATNSTLSSISQRLSGSVAVLHSMQPSMDVSNNFYGYNHYLDKTDSYPRDCGVIVDEKKIVKMEHDRNRKREQEDLKLKSQKEGLLTANLYEDKKVFLSPVHKRLSPKESDSESVSASTPLDFKIKNSSGPNGSLYKNSNVENASKTQKRANPFMDFGTQMQIPAKYNNLDFELDDFDIEEHYKVHESVFDPDEKNSDLEQFKGVCELITVDPMVMHHDFFTGIDESTFNFYKVHGSLSSFAISLQVKDNVIPVQSTKLVPPKLFKENVSLMFPDIKPELRKKDLRTNIFVDSLIINCKHMFPNIKSRTIPIRGRISLFLEPIRAKQKFSEFNGIVGDVLLSFERSIHVFADYDLTHLTQAFNSKRKYMSQLLSGVEAKSDWQMAKEEENESEAAERMELEEEQQKILDPFIKFHTKKVYKTKTVKQIVDFVISGTERGFYSAKLRCLHCQKFSTPQKIEDKFIILAIIIDLPISNFKRINPESSLMFEQLDTEKIQEINKKFASFSSKSSPNNEDPDNDDSISQTPDEKSNNKGAVTPLSEEKAKSKKARFSEVTHIIPPTTNNNKSLEINTARPKSEEHNHLGIEIKPISDAELSDMQILCPKPPLQKILITPEQENAMQSKVNQLNTSLVSNLDAKLSQSLITAYTNNGLPVKRKEKNVNTGPEKSSLVKAIDELEAKLAENSLNPQSGNDPVDDRENEQKKPVLNRILCVNCHDLARPNFKMSLTDAAWQKPLAQIKRYKNWTKQLIMDMKEAGGKKPLVIIEIGAEAAMRKIAEGLLKQTSQTGGALIRIDPIIKKSAASDKDKKQQDQNKTEKIVVVERGALSVVERTDEILRQLAPKAGFVL